MPPEASPPFPTAPGTATALSPATGTFPTFPHLAVTGTPATPFPASGFIATSPTVAGRATTASPHPSGTPNLISSFPADEVTAALPAFPGPFPPAPPPSLALAVTAPSPPAARAIATPPFSGAGTFPAAAFPAAPAITEPSAAPPPATGGPSMQKCPLREKPDRSARPKNGYTCNRSPGATRNSNRATPSPRVAVTSRARPMCPGLLSRTWKTCSVSVGRDHGDSVPASQRSVTTPSAYSHRIPGEGSTRPSLTTRFAKSRTNPASS